MKKALLQALAVLGMYALPVYLVAQPPAPQTYKLVAEAAGPDLKMAISIYRDGARERIEQTLNGSQMTMSKVPARLIGQRHHEQLGVPCRPVRPRHKRLTPTQRSLQ